MRGDATWLHQLFANLIHNAIKFTSPGGHVRLSCETDDEVVIVRLPLATS